MPAAAPKRPKSASAPKAPKAPTSKSKTGNSACSQAASNWQLAIRGKAPIEPDTYKTLAKCRGMLRTSKAADGRAAAGYNLSDQGAAAIKGRLQSRFDRDLVSDKSRAAKVKELLAGRAAKQAAPVAAAVTKSAGQAQDDRMRRLGAGTDVDVKRKRDWRQSQVASARNSLVHSREDRASLQQSRDAINHTTRDRELPWMIDGVPITGDPNHRPQVKAPVARYTAARKEKAGQLLKERGERTISEPDRKKAMSIAKRVTKAPSRKQAAPVAAKPTALPPRTADTMSEAIALSSPNGKMSKRSRLAANQRAGSALFGPNGMPAPQVKQPSEIESLRRNATELRDLASRGMKPRAHTKTALQLEQKANELENPPAPAPAKFSRNGELAPGRGTAERSAKAAQLDRYRKILPSVDGSATQPRLFSTGPNKTQHLVATVRSSNKYGLMRQRATNNKERVSDHFGVGHIIGSGDKRHHNTDFRGRALSDDNRGKEAVKSAIDDLREKRADRPSDPTKARLASPFGMRQILAKREASQTESAKPKPFSRNGQLAPGRGKDDPSYDDRSNALRDKVWARARKVPRNRSDELRSTGERLSNAASRSIRKKIDAERASIEAYDAKQAAAAPKPKAKPAPVQASTRKPMYRPLGHLERGSNGRSSGVASATEARASKTLQREANRNAIPLSFKKQVTRGYTAEVFRGPEGALTPKLVKRVTGSTGIQKEKVNNKNEYRVVSLAETHFGTTAGSGRDEKHATRMAKILDYMGRRAQRTTGGSDPMDAVTKNPVAGRQYRDLFAVSKRVDRRLVNTR